jgi:hypothetical protein
MFRTAKAMALISVSLVAACGAGERNASTEEGEAGSKPSLEAIQKIESDISHDPCVGPVDHWQRLYAYRDKDERIIGFLYREAGRFGFVPGVTVRNAEDWDAIDDRPYKRVDGSYDIATSRLSVEYCGLNAPDDPAAERRRGASGMK